jgi:hypothetical protein
VTVQQQVGEHATDRPTGRRTVLKAVPREAIGTVKPLDFGYGTEDRVILWADVVQSGPGVAATRKINRMWTIRYVRERFWKGSYVRDLSDAQRQAEAWCVQVAGRRMHGSVGHVPLVAFEGVERTHRLPIADEPYNVRVWRSVSVQPDHHINFESPLYAAPSGTCPHLEVRSNRAAVNLYRAASWLPSLTRHRRTTVRRTGPSPS